MVDVCCSPILELNDALMSDIHGSKEWCPQERLPNESMIAPSSRRSLTVSAWPPTGVRQMALSIGQKQLLVFLNGTCPHALFQREASCSAAPRQCSLAVIADENQRRPYIYEGEFKD